MYGLSLADSLIRSGTARRVLLITSETYSKYIHPADRSLRTIFGDGAAATLIDAADQPSLGSFVFGTDGSGADTLMVVEGGARPKDSRLQPRKRQRWGSQLYMDGPGLIKFTVDVVPTMVERILKLSGWSRDQVELYLLHQATSFLLEQIRERLGITLEQAPLALAEYGNTVSSTIPILIRDLRLAGRLRPGTQSLMIGFGVGLSWCGCAWTDTWDGKQAC
jgi:3-oxoacyl-[acyl-carrier-protein] synthase-3